MSTAEGRVTVVLCTPLGRLLGALPSLEVDLPWWPDVGDVVRAARAAYAVDIVVLRLLSATRALGAPGGQVTYLAQVGSAPAVPLTPWAGNVLAEDPLRQNYAQPGGPDADLAWADAVLRDRATPRIGPAEQLRTWNLSSLWRLPTASGPVWLKAVPPFFAHEGAILARLDSAAVPRLIAHSGQRALLADVPGADQYDAPLPVLLDMLQLLVDLQTRWMGRTGELLALGLPDWRPEQLTAAADDVISRRSAELGATTLAALRSLTGAAAQRWEQIEACGIPDSLVHGDFHPGNLRGGADCLVLLDWGDCGVGHPLLDDAAFTDRLSVDDRAAVRVHWQMLWARAVPGSDAGRAADLLAPIAALRQAVIYQRFLDRIEATEQIYHAADPAIWLRRAGDLAASHDGPQR